MKSILLTVIMCTFSTMITAQSWPFADAHWLYDWNSIDENGRIEAYIAADTLIDGEAWSPLRQQRSYTFITDPDGGVFTGLSSEYTRALLKYRGDSLMRLHEDVEFLLYDFGADVGDSWLMEIMDIGGCLPDSHYVQVVDTGSIEIAGVSRRYIDLAPALGSAFALEGRVVEGVGPINGEYWTLFPTYVTTAIVDSCMLVWDGEITTLSCYSDEDFIYPETGADCLPLESWVEEDASWCFAKSQIIGGDYGGCECWEYANDSLIDGQVYQILRGVWHAEYFYVEGTIDIVQDDILLRTSGDSLLNRVGDTDRLIADFGASAGDSWVVTPQPTSMGYQGQDLTITVDSVYVTDYGESARRTIAYTTAINDPDDPNCEQIWSGAIVEGLYFSTGSVSEHILPVWPDSYCPFDVNDLNGFSHHESASSPFYSESTFGSSTSCGEYVSLLENSVARSLDAFPNPSSVRLNVRIPLEVRDGKLHLYDLDGRPILGRTVAEAELTSIDLSSLERGIYLLVLSTPQGDWVSKVVKE